MELFTESPVDYLGDDTRKKINRDFIIRWRADGERYANLIGAGKYPSFVGEDLASKHFKKVLNSPDHTIRFKLRRGVEVKFVSR